MATAEQRLDLLELLVANLPDTWGRLFTAGLDTLGAMIVSERERWVEIIVNPYRKDLPTAYVLWDWLHRIMDGTAPSPVMSMILDANLLTKVPEPERGNAAWLELIAAICPASQRRELREQLAPFEPSQTVTPLTLLEILDGMENDRIHV